MPSRCFRKSKRPPTASVAEVSTTVSNASNSRSRRIALTSIGVAATNTPLFRAFEPVDVVLFLRLQQEGQFAAQLGGAPRDGHQLLRLCRQRGDFRFQRLRSAATARRRPSRFCSRKAARAAGSNGERPSRGGKALEKFVRAFAQARHAPQQRRPALLRQPHRLFGVARQLLEAVIGNLPAEVIAGHVLDFVRLVENHRRIFRQDAAEIVLPQRQVREKQVMIDDDHVGFGGPLVHRGDEAAVELGAFLARAGLAPRVEPRPQLRVVRQKAQLGAVAGFRQLAPNRGSARTSPAPPCP